MNTCKNITSTFIKYVSQNILGMLGISAYILADTFFISKAAGSNGLTALNLVLPLYSIIFAIGSMIGVGAATKYKIQFAKNELDTHDYFSNSIFFSTIFGLFFALTGLFFSKEIVILFGADETILKLAEPYTRIFMLFAPFFMLNYIINAFVRNDNNPSLAMAATLSSSIFNIVFDYILMFIFDMGMEGAALATAFSPVIGIIICVFHFRSKKNTIRFKWQLPSIATLVRSCRLGISAFIGELSSGVTTTVFNFLILGLTGNQGVAAFGIVANIAIVATAIFNGISQGAQPLFSEYYGKGNKKSINATLKLSIITALSFTAIMILLINIFKAPVVGIFNSEHNVLLSEYATKGLSLYFIGYIFAGFNIIATGYLSATESAIWAFITSILRGVIGITLCALIMANLFGMTGIWLAFATSECITSVVAIIAIKHNKSLLKL